MVARVQAGSAAGRTGLQVGDFVLKVSGKDMCSADSELVLRILREGVGGEVELRVARPFPVPVTDKEKMRALLVLQTKVSRRVWSPLPVLTSFPLDSHSAGQWHDIPA